MIEKIKEVGRRILFSILKVVAMFFIYLLGGKHPEYAAFGIDSIGLNKVKNQTLRIVIIPVQEAHIGIEPCQH